MTEAKQEAFTLTKADVNVTSADGKSSSTLFYTIWSYKVPDGTGLILLPGHLLSVYLEDTNDAEMPNTVLLRISYVDSSQQDRKGVIPAFNYGVCKTFDDTDKIMRLNVTAPVKVYEKQYLIIEATGNGNYGVDQTGSSLDSYFSLAISRVRKPL